jgi:hypothetical protein
MFSISKTLKAAAIAIPMGLASLGAHATSVPGTENFSWSFNTGAGVTITGNGSIALSASGTILTALVTLNNTTALPAGTNMALLSFGFGIDPNATGVTFQDAVDGGMSAAVMAAGGNDKIPSLTGIEVCAFGGNSCSGGPVNNGIQAGGSDTFTLLLTGASAWPSTVTIAPIGFKFQGTVGSFEFFTNSTSTTTTTTTGTPSTSGGVPAPASTLTLLGLGLIGMGYARRMKTAR